MYSSGWPAAAISTEPPLLTPSGQSTTSSVNHDLDPSNGSDIGCAAGCKRLSCAVESRWLPCPAVSGRYLASRRPSADARHQHGPTLCHRQLRNTRRRTQPRSLGCRYAPSQWGRCGGQGAPGRLHAKARIRRGGLLRIRSACIGPERQHPAPPSAGKGFCQSSVITHIPANLAMRRSSPWFRPSPLGGQPPCVIVLRLPRVCGFRAHLLHPAFQSYP